MAPSPHLFADPAWRAQLACPSQQDLRRQARQAGGGGKVFGRAEGESRKELLDRLYGLRKATAPGFARRPAGNGLELAEVAADGAAGPPTGFQAEEGRLLASLQGLDGQPPVPVPVASERANPPSDGLEPNNDKTGATVLTLSGGQWSNAALSIHAIGDEDWYRYVSGAATLLNVELAFAGGSGTQDLELELRDAAGTAIIRKSWSGEARESITYPVSAATTYYLRVFGAVGANAVNSYSMRVEELAPDPFEPNSSAATATSTSNPAFKVPGYYPNLNIHSTTDSEDDWYRVDLAAAATLTIQLTFSPGGGAADDGWGDIDLFLFNAVPNGSGGYNQGSQVARSISGDPDELLSIQVPAGSYFVQVDGSAGATNLYDMSISTFALPKLPALELGPGETSIAATDARIQAVLNDLSTGGKPFSNDLAAGFQFPIGSTKVTWSIWDDAVGGALLAKVSEQVVVLPFGQTPLYLSGPSLAGDVQGAYATAGNHGGHIVRTADGTLHIAWHDLFAKKIFYQRSLSQDAATGVVAWDLASRTEIAAGNADSESFVAIAASANAVHFAWEFGGTVKYRRLLRSGSTWTLEALRNTTAATSSRDNGPDIAVYNDSEIHVIFPAQLDYVYSLNAGATWSKEDLNPLKPVSGGVKYPSVAVDSRGDVHVVFTLTVRGGWPPGIGGHWKNIYLHRKRPLVAGENGVGTGKWIENHDTNANFSEWADLGPGETVKQTLSDWVEIQVDAQDNIHLGWHGTAISLSAGYDDAFYQFRPASGMGNPNAWQRPLSLHGGSSLGQYSFTPSLAADAQTGVAIPVLMYKALGLGPYNPTDPMPNYNDLASAMRILRTGQFLDSGAVTNLSSYGIDNYRGMETWWPTAAPGFHRLGSKVWLDVLHALLPAPSDARGLVVHQRVDITNLIPPDKVANPDPAHLSANISVNKDLGWSGARAASFDIYLGTSQAAVDAATTASPQFKGNQAGASFDPGLLSVSTTYYWRIDTLNPRGRTKGDTWSFTTSAAGNQPPVLAAIPNQTVGENQLLALQLSASDPNGDVLVFSASGLPSGATLNPSSGAFSWTPGYTQAGSYTVTFTVSDGSASDSKSVTIQVTETNRPPVFLASQPSATPTTVQPGEAVTFDGSATDPDGDALVYAWNFGDGTSANGAGVKHAYLSPGTYKAVIEVTDGRGGRVSAELQIVVKDSGADSDGDGLSNDQDLDDDGDGVSDENEAADGTDPLDPLDFKKIPMQVLVLSGKMRLSQAGSDLIVLSAVIPDLAPGFSPKDQELEVRVGGAAEGFTLDAKGRSAGGNGVVRARFKFSKAGKGQPKQFAGGNVPVKIRMGPGDYRGSWADEGVDTASAASNAPLELEVLFYFGGRVYAATVWVNLNLKPGKSGVFRSLR